MSNPQRFLVAGYDGWMQSFESGDYVKYDDYARLQAEFANLKGDYNRLLLHCEALENDLEEGKKP